MTTLQSYLFIAKQRSYERIFQTQITQMTQIFIINQIKLSVSSALSASKKFIFSHLNSTIRS